MANERTLTASLTRKSTVFDATFEQLQKFVERARCDELGDRFITDYVVNAAILNEDGRLTIKLKSKLDDDIVVLNDIASYTAMSEEIAALQREIDSSVAVLTLESSTGVIPEELMQDIIKKKSLRFDFNGHLYTLSQINDDEFVYKATLYDENNHIQCMNKLTLDIVSREYEIENLVDNRLANIQSDLGSLHRNKVSASTALNEGTDYTLRLLTD